MGGDRAPHRAPPFQPRPARAGAGAWLGAACVAACLVAATCGERRAPEPVLPPPLELTRVPARADLGRRAYDHVAALVALGPRWSGSPGWRQGVDYIVAQLRLATGLEPVVDRWTEERFGLALANVHVTLPGKSEDRILLGCHHDTKKCEGHPDPRHNFVFVGANDSGSGVGLLLALAKDLAGQERQASVQIAFFDGEECVQFKWNEQQALFGSKRFVATEQALASTEPERGRIRAMVLLDMVGARDVQIDEETNSDPGLRQVFRAAAQACGQGARFFKGRMAISDDHLPFLRAKIPAIDLIDLVDNPQWHTPNDTLEHIEASSLHLVGEVVLTALPAIEARCFAEAGKR